jgi:rhodanese-related sulfurtransferase
MGRHSSPIPARFPVQPAQLAPQGNDIMSAVVVEGSAVLDQARADAQAHGLPYAGSVAPVDTWALVQGGHAVLVDVRSAEERKFVGQVPQGEHVVWAIGTSLTRNPRFVRELEARVKKDDVVLLLCRSGKRSALAAEAATKAGFKHVFNVREGFEGELDARQQRGKADGWRFHGLPWVQD